MLNPWGVPPPGAPPLAADIIDGSALKHLSPEERQEILQQSTGGAGSDKRKRVEEDEDEESEDEDDDDDDGESGRYSVVIITSWFNLAV